MIKELRYCMMPYDDDNYLIESLNLENMDLENKFLISVRHEKYQMHFSSGDTFSGYAYFMVDVEYIKEFEIYITIFFKRLLEVNYEEFLEKQKKEFMAKNAKELLS